MPTLRYTHGSQDAIRVERRVPDGTPIPEYTKMFDRFGAQPPAGPGHLVDTLPPSMEIGGERPSVKMRNGGAREGITRPWRAVVCVRRSSFSAT